ncbi:hypothetical protein [Marinilabilia sp.]|uniref:hypothetical protein n=1 Tax=Marinilabilia sp. TaxID=2021252 RepID=UPI0025C64391|nr:hypothetical protein [Marinilabilia sp.]
MCLSFFGGVECLSTHWPGTFSKKNNPIPEAFTNYFEENLPSSEGYKIYFDHGIETLDAIHLLIQKEIDQVMLLIENPVSNYVT